MSAPERTAASTRASAPVRKPRVTVAQLLLRAVQRWRRNRAVNELARLDDRQLMDIGVSRNDIPRVVEGLISSGEADVRPLPRVVYRWESPTIAAEPCRRAA